MPDEYGATLRPRRKKFRTLLFDLFGLLLLLVVHAPGAFAQTGEADWPSRAVHFIVPFPAGSATDIVARIVAEKLAQASSASHS